MVQRGRIAAHDGGRFFDGCKCSGIVVWNSLSVALFFTLSAEKEPSGHKPDQDAANGTSYGCPSECSCGVTRRAIVARRR